MATRRGAGLASATTGRHFGKRFPSFDLLRA
jgi:hypothetical protein